jgi:hypothetical protein
MVNVDSQLRFHIRKPPPLRATPDRHACGRRTSLRLLATNPLILSFKAMP